MVSKNNRIKKQEKAAECQSHFAIRKLTIGAASVLLGTTLWLNNGNVVKADANSDKGDTNKAGQESSNPMSSNNNSSDAKKVVVVTEDTQSDIAENQTKHETKDSTQQTDTTLKQRDQQSSVNDSISENKGEKVTPDTAPNLNENNSSNTKDKIESKTKIVEKQTDQSKQAQSNQLVDKDELARRKEAISTQIEKAKENTAQVPEKTSPANQDKQFFDSPSTSTKDDIAKENTTSILENQSPLNPTLAQAGQQGKQSKDSKSEQLDLFQIGEKGKVQDDLTKDKNLEDSEKELLKQKENVLNIAANKEAALDPEKVKQLANLSTEQVAQLYGTSLVQANSIKSIFDQLKGLDFSKIKDSVSQIAATVQDPDVQKAAKDLLSGNFSLSTLSDLKKASSKVSSLTNGLKDLAGELSKNTSSGSTTGSILDKLKDFKLPDITKIKPALDGINTAMKDPSVQKVIQDVTSGNMGSAIMDMGTALPVIEQNLAPLNSLVKDATGVDVMDQVKSKLPNVDPTTLSNALSGVSSMMKDPDVQKAIKDITSGSLSLSDVTAIPKIINGLKPVGNLVKDLLPHKDSGTTDPDKDTGKTSWFDKLKNLVPSFTDEEITAAKNAIQRTISDPLIKNVVTDVITQNYPKLLMDVIHYGPTTLKNAKTSIEEITKAIKDAKDQKAQNITYTYTINYMDGKTKVSSQQISGKPGTTETITVKIPDGYEVTAGTSVPGTYTFTTKNESIDIAITKKDDTKPVDPDAKDHTLTINYVLSDGSAVGAPQTITGKAGESKTITAQIPAGYKLTNGTNVPGLYTFKDADDSINITVEKIENTKPDTPTGDVVLTINYKDGDKVVGSQTVSGKAGSEVTITPQVPQGYKVASTAVVPATYTLGDKNSSLDISVVADSSSKPDHPDHPDNPDQKPDTPTIDQKAQLVIVDQDDNDNQIKAEGIETSFISNGKSGDAIDFGNTLNSIAALQKLGYVLVSNNLPTDAKFDNDSDSDKVSQTYQIIMKHGVQEVTAATNPSSIPAKAQATIKPADLTKKVNLTVTYTNSDGTAFTGEVPANAKQTITFNGTAYVDKVTGRVVNVKNENGNLVVDNDNLAIPEISWKADNDEFSAVISPKEIGYKVVSVSNYSAGDNVDKITKLLPTSGDIKVSVVYAPDDASVPTPAKQGSVKVIVFDQTNNEIVNGYGYFTGKVDEGIKLNFLDHDKQIQELENKGYDIVSDPTDDLPQTVADADLTYRLIVKHHIISVSPANPATPGSLIVSGNSYNKYPSDTSADSLAHTITRTITYAGTPTEVAPVVETLKFTAQGYLDAVTGKWTTQDGHELQNQADHYVWTSQDGTKFSKVTSPYFKNYHVTTITSNGNGYGDVSEIDSIDQNTKDINIVVNYAPNGEIVAVDATGKEIAPRIQYVTNPANLTKVMPEEAVPEVAGYTTQTKTVTPVDAAVNTSVVYTAIPTKVKKGRMIITVHDNTLNTDLSNYGYDSKRQKIGYAVDFDKDNTIASLEKAGYKILNPDVVIPQKVTKGKHTVTLYVEHKITPITEDNNSQKVALTKTATQTVHYKGAGDSTPEDNVSTIKFVHNISLDEVTGELIDNGWTPETQTYKTIITPNIAGYTASVSAVGGDQININDNNLDRTYTVTYTMNPVQVMGSVTYVDDVTGNVLENQNFLGNSGDNIKYDPAKEIAKYEAKGYKLVQNDLNGEKKLTDQNNNFEIHFTHTTSQLDANNLVGNYSKDDLDKTITRTVKYVYTDGAKSLTPIKQEVHLTASGIIDDVTGQLVSIQDGKIISNGKLTWRAVGEDSFAVVPALDLDGYYISEIKENGINTSVSETGQVASEKVTNTTPNGEIVITISKKAPVDINGSVSYVDDTTGNLIEVDKLGGQVGQLINYNTSNIIQGYLNKGYKLVSNNFRDSISTFDGNAEKNNFQVHLVHTTSNIDMDHLAGNYTKDDLTKEVSRTINYIYADGTKSVDPIKQEVTFEATGTIDNVTGQLVSVQDGKIIPNGKLTWKAVGEDSFAAVPTLDLDGYYISGINQNNSQATVNSNGQVSGEKVSPLSTNSNIVITLSKKAPAAATGTVIYYDDTLNTPIETIKLGGKAGQTIDYDNNAKLQLYLKQGYKLVKSDLNKDQKFEQDSAKNNFEIHLVHTTSPVNDEKTVTRSVTYVDEAGKTVLPSVKQDITFKGQATKDDVTGKLVNLNSDGSIKDQNGQMTWTAQDSEFSEIPAVDSTKYTVVRVKENNSAVDLKTGKVASEKVNANTPDNDIMITLNNVVAPKGSITVVVHDETANKDLADYGKTSGKEEVGSSFNYDLAGEIKNLEDKGYKVVNKDLTIPKEITSGDQKLVLYVEHATEPVSNNKDVTRTINYVDEKGKNLASAIKQTVHFTQSGVKDKVTGKFTTPLTWNETSEDVQNAVSPDIDGYHVVKVSQDAEGNNVKAIALKNSDDSYDVFVTYAKNSDPVKPDDGKSDGKTDPVKPDDNKSDSNTDSANTNSGNTSTSDQVQLQPTQPTTSSDATTTPQEEASTNSETNESNPVDSTSTSDDNKVSNSDDSDVSDDVDSSDEESDPVSGQIGKTSASWKNSFGPHAETLNNKNNAVKAKMALTDKNNKISSNKQNISQTSNKQLPQTGSDNQTNTAQALLGATVSALGMIGLAGVKKRRKQN